LLPRGWSDAFAGIEDIAPAGGDGDETFVASGDTVHFALALAGPPTAVTVRLVYLPLSARLLGELLGADTPATRDLAHYLEEIVLGPELVSEAEWSSR
jgi:hypothetical protein